MNAARKREKAVLASAMAQGGAEASGEKIAAMMKAVVQQRHMQEQVQVSCFVPLHFVRILLTI